MAAVSPALMFPGIADQFLLRPDVTFLNHGSFGSTPKPVFDTYQYWQRELEFEPVDFLARRLSGLLSDARRALGEYVGTSGDNLVFVPNATYGMNVVAHALDLQSGDEVLGTDHEYGAVERTWTYYCEARGARYVSAPVPLPVTTREDFVERLWSHVTERTKMISISHITSPTALTFPVEEVCRRAREAGILTAIDGAHAPGQISLSLDELGADFYTGNCHKWLCAAKGAAFLYARPELQEGFSPFVISWGWRSELPGPSRLVDHLGWVGTKDPAAYLSVTAAIEFVESNDWDRVRVACHELAVEAAQRIGAITGLPPISPDDWFVQMRAIELPMTGGPELHRRLWEEYRIEVPVTKWRDRLFVRVSIQAYNGESDVDALVSALRELLV